MDDMISNLLIRKEEIQIDPKKIGQKLGYIKEEPSAELKEKICEVKEQLLALMKPRVSFIEAMVERIEKNQIRLAGLLIESRALAERLLGCEKAYLYRAQIGSGAEDEIAKQMTISEKNGMIYEAAFQAAREALCEEVERQIFEMENKMVLKTRFSILGQELSEKMQEKIMRLLDKDEKRKSYKAAYILIGVTKEKTAHTPGSKCASCPQLDCEYRDKEFK
jgi:Fe2+ transport system protein B